jgi:cytoskeleton protein RodZ
MTEAQPGQPDDVAAAASASTLTLREAREAAGLPIATLAATLKVSADRLQALEDGRYADLPNLTFARALASSVCRALKLDPAVVLAGLPQAGEVKLGSDQLPEPATFRGRRSVVAGGSRASKRVPLLGAVVVLLAAAALWWWLPQQDDEGGQAVAPAVADVADSSAQNAVPAQEPVAEAVPAAAVPSPAPSVPQPAVPAPVQSQPAPVVAPAPVAPAAAVPVAAAVSAPAPAPDAAQPAQPAQPALRLRASQAVWVQVNDAAGKQLLQRTLKAGETADLSAAGPYAVVLGRAGAVEVSVHGKVMDLSAYASNRVARFEVK